MLEVNKLYSLKPCTYIVGISPDEVRLAIRHDTEISIRGDCRATLTFLELLNGVLPLRDVIDTVITKYPSLSEEEVHTVAATLLENELLAEGNAFELSSSGRYSRQISYLSLFTSDPPLWREQQERLMQAHVTILGMGGIGAPAADLLVRAGVGTVRCVDNDAIEESNLNRQTLYFTSDVGRQKVRVAASRLKDANIDVRIETSTLEITCPKDICKVIEGTDFLLVSADTPRGIFPFWVNQASIDTGVPYLLSGYSGDIGLVGPLIVPGNTLCLLCGTSRDEQMRFHPSLLSDVRERVIGLDSRFQPPSVGPICLMVAAMATLEIFRWLTKCARPLSLGKILTFDTRTFQGKSVLLGTRDSSSRHDYCPCKTFGRR